MRGGDEVDDAAIFPDTEDSHGRQGDLGMTREGRTRDDDYIYEDIAVEDIMPDDEILSLNDKTGEWEWRKVEKTMDMGIQEVFKIYTRSGLSIETTANHPYLVKVRSGRPETLPLGGTYEVDQSPKLEDMTKDSFIAIANSNQKYVLKLSAGFASSNEAVANNSRNSTAVFICSSVSGFFISSGYTNPPRVAA